MAVPVATKTSYDQGTQTDAERPSPQVSVATLPQQVSEATQSPLVSETKLPQQVSVAIETACYPNVAGKTALVPDSLKGLGEGEIVNASSEVAVFTKAPKKRMFKPCVHNVRKDTCRICSSKRYCEHERLRCTCVPCGGSQICVHKRQKNICPECDGAVGVCIHKKAKRTCKECSVANGTYVAPVRTRIHKPLVPSARIHKSSNKDCEHGVRKTNCRICSKQTFCVHGRKKETCVPCGGKLVCEHKRQRNTCMSCVGAGICEHLKVRRKCQECLANQQGGAVIAPQQLEQIQGEVPRDVIMAEAGGVAV